jgi:hypothetical protein
MTSNAVLEFFETVHVGCIDGRRVVSIPDINRFWAAYDALADEIEQEQRWLGIEQNRTRDTP